MNIEMMSDCEKEGTSGNCGFECSVFQNGKCEIPSDVILERYDIDQDYFEFFFSETSIEAENLNVIRNDILVYHKLNDLAFLDKISKLIHSGNEYLLIASQLAQANGWSKEEFEKSKKLFEKF